MMTMTKPLHVQRAGERANLDHGWLQTSHSFSFGSYFDPNNLSWGTLRVFNDDVVAAGKGFGTHPHRDMEILTYVLEGELAHRDSMGNERIVKPGGVQYLSAGTGISHSEYNHRSDTPLHFVQMWVVPKAQGLEPRYGQVDFRREDRLNRWLTVASGIPAVEAPIEIWQNATCDVARLEETHLSRSVAAGRLAFLFVAAGDVSLGDQTLHAGDSARIVGPFEIELAGTGEAVLWDVPPLGVAA
jgi:redox-sensitive bicupin YhaK (pirin superfamily)